MHPSLSSLAALAVLLSTSCLRPPPRDVTIEARDYAFRAPASLAPGLTSFRFVNRGSHLHEVQIFRFARGVSAAAANTMLAADSIPDPAADSSGSVLITAPGIEATERVLVSLKRGDMWGLVCDFRDAPGQQRHAKMGMVALIQVR